MCEEELVVEVKESVAVEVSREASARVVGVVKVLSTAELLVTEMPVKASAKLFASSSIRLTGVATTVS